IALGGVRRSVSSLPPAACAAALAAAEATGVDLAGVDLLPDGAGGWIAIEVNGAVEFSAEYARSDVFADVAACLARAAVARQRELDVALRAARA
ncbi:MAG: hypothetical protein NZL88_06390, partial [Gaiellaceae bacterium]|nr:hypothetical protein [Gaiellaceae bacterium]